MPIKITIRTVSTLCVIILTVLLQSCSIIRNSTQIATPVTILDSAAIPTGQLSAPWRHILPETSKSYANYEVREGRDGRFLYMQSGGADSWFERDLGSINPHNYPEMSLTWMVSQIPATEWEANAGQTDFACRIELVYDYTYNSFNPLYIARKGLINRFFRGNPPEMIISYVWSKNLPPNDDFISPEGNNIIIIPLENEMSPQNRWIETKRNIANDFDRLIDSRNIVLKKIRIRCDTGDTGTTASCAIKTLILAAD